jgi:hypothetical protein
LQRSENAKQIELAIVETGIRAGQPLPRKMHRHARPVAHPADTLGNGHPAEKIDLHLFRFGRSVGKHEITPVMLAPPDYSVFLGRFFFVFGAAAFFGAAFFATAFFGAAFFAPRTGFFAGACSARTFNRFKA